ncbi:MAG: M28 family peptidase [bacterium]
MVAEKYTNFMYNFIKRVMDEVGPRVPCSEDEKKAGRMLVNELKPVCDRVDVEKFRCSPYAFLGFLPFAVLLYLVALPLYWYYPPAALAISVAGFCMLFFQFVRYREFLDFMFPKREGENVLGIIKPKGEIKRRLIVGGHLDSAYEFNLWYIFKNAAIPVMIVGIAAVLLLLGGSAAKTIAFFMGGAGAPVYRIIGIICVALSPFVSLFIVFHTYKPVPGAMDDIAGVAVAAGLGKYLADAKKDGSFFPQNTEVVIFGVSSEEAGLRGSKRYITKHREELSKTPTYVIMVDGVCEEEYLTVIDREICMSAKHSPELVQMALDSAAERKLKMRKKLVPLGASDASAFSVAGVPATCILCQNVDKLVFNYHTRHDVIDHIRPEALTVSLQVVIDMLEKIDRKTSD